MSRRRIVGTSGAEDSQRDRAKDSEPGSPIHALIVSRDTLAGRPGAVQNPFPLRVNRRRLLDHQSDGSPLPRLLILSFLDSSLFEHGSYLLALSFFNGAPQGDAGFCRVDPFEPLEVLPKADCYHGAMTDLLTTNEVNIGDLGERAQQLVVRAGSTAL
jgi:hypothetical protein